MRNDSTRALRFPPPRSAPPIPGLRPPRWAWLPDVLTGTAIVAIVALVLLATACSSGDPGSAGSGGAPTAGGSAGSPSAVGYSHCMRTHGVPGYPDPSSNGTPPKTGPQQLGVSVSRLQTAQAACQHLLPNAASFQQRTQQCMLTGDCPPALVRRILTAELRFARCMRSHGVPDWPDPSIGPGGRPSFNVSARGIDPHHSPQVNSEAGDCERLTGNPPVPLR